VSDASAAAERDGFDDLLTEPTWVYRTIHAAVWLEARIWHRLSVEGLEHLPRDGGCLIASNHQSFLDIPLIAAAVPRHVSFVARDTLARSKLLAFIMKGCGAVLVKRGAADRRALREMAVHIERGDCVSIFPEGTRTEDGDPREFKGGVLLAARMARAPIVPLAIEGAFAAYPRGARFVRPAKVRLRFGPPIDPRGEGATAELERSVRAMLADLRAGD
jgi:1-acyl-sn-glycerol-3-phosphate acyltransferase